LFSCILFITSIQLLFVQKLPTKSGIIDQRKLIDRSVQYFSTEERWLPPSKEAPSWADLENEYSIVAACKMSRRPSRSSNFEVALNSWLLVESVRQVIIIDWASGHCIRDAIDTAANENLTVKIDLVEVKTGQSFRLSVAYNYAFGLAHSENILKVDCDTEIAPHFLSENGISSHIPLRRGVDFSQVTDNDMHLNGVFVAKKSLVLRVGGYDEKIEGYGWDDSDMYLRLSVANGCPAHASSLLSAVNGCPSFKPPYLQLRDQKGLPIIQHLQHDRAFPSLVEDFHTCFNRETSLQLPANYDMHGNFRAWRQPRANFDNCVKLSEERPRTSYLVCSPEKHVKSYQDIFLDQNVATCHKIVMNCRKEVRRRAMSHESKRDLRTLSPRQELHYQFCGEKNSLASEVQHLLLAVVTKVYRYRVVILVGGFVLTSCVSCRNGSCVVDTLNKMG